ncbi:MAG: SDR family oxidoreductase [Syntrophaceae bacterium]|nr:SDR family oxidoreductase [Syntrophaceae bacterium]
MLKNVLVAGASSGIGLATSRQLNTDGFCVYAGAQSFGEEQEAPEGFIMLPLDVTDDLSVQETIKRILQRDGRIDALVNCAAFLTLGACEEVSAEELRLVMETNFLGMARMTRAVLPAMRERQYGRIVNISSLNGLFGIPFQGAYTASKHAIEGWSESLAQETRRFGIYVTVVEPGDCRGGSLKYRTRAKAAEQEMSPYAGRYKKTVDKIMHDEQNGICPERVARAISGILQSQFPPARRIIADPVQRSAVFLHTLLPRNVFNRMIEVYYAAGSTGARSEIKKSEGN